MTRVVVVTGATGVTGRATAAALSARGDTVVAVGTDSDRLSTVDAADRRVVDLTDRAATERLAADVVAAHGRVDGLLHLVGGWRAGSSPADLDWLTARLVTTLVNASEAFETSLVAAAAGRLAIVSSTVVRRDAPPTTAYATAKLAAENWLHQLTARWSGTEAAAVTFVVRSIDEGEPGGHGTPGGSTPVATLAAALVGLWDRPAAELAGARIQL